MNTPDKHKGLAARLMTDPGALSEAPTTEGSSLHARSIVAKRYEILSRLGKGGMGEVWHAYDLILRVDVALKSLRHDLTKKSDPVEALRREVLAAREVLSPNVCRIFDLVVEEDQELISMEYIDGTTLLTLLVQRGTMEIPEARDIAAQFLAGLDAIHQAGLVHRDLKPENIMITRTGRVVVMDFGIAKPASQEGATISGTLPYMSPEQLSGNKVDARSDVFSAGVVLAEMIHPDGIVSEKTREGIWNAVRKDPRKLAESPWKAVITRAVSFNPQDRFPSARALSRALEEATQRVETIEERKPYPGLSSFTAGDAQYFFGRELEVETVIKKLQQLHLMAVVGASGAGKTSFLRAGLIPALPTGWNCLFCVPGDSPVLNLGQALVPQLSGDTEAMQKVLRLDHPNALWLLNQWRKKHTETVLIIDRFEELFTLNASETQSKFCEMIASAALELDIRVLLSMRDDFLLRCHDYESLSPLFSELTPLGPLNGPALRRALVQPALKCGYRFEDETLVDEILADLERERGALPLMAFAAAKLWEKRNREAGLLTREAYREIGGVAGALAQHAEATVEKIGTDRLPIVREIFRNLVTAQNTRCVRDREELLSVFENRQVADEALRMLVDARLLTSFEAPQADEEIPRRRVEIIHESLLSAWPRLVRWQTQDADGAQLRDQLRQATQLWEQRNRSEDLLWTGTAFLEYQAWRQRYPGGLTATEEAFAQAMVRRANQKRMQRRIAISAMFIVLLIVLAVISNFWHKATVAKDQAVSEARRAEAGKVLVIGRSQTNANPSTKLAYALASLQLADSTEARRFALQALSVGPPALVMNFPKKRLNSIEFGPDGKWIAVGIESGLELLPQDGTDPIQVSKPNTSAGKFIPWSPQFSANGEFLIWTMRDDTRVVKAWSPSQRKVVRSFQFEGTTICLVRGENAFLITDATGSHDAPFNWSKFVIRKWRFDAGEPEVVGRFNTDSVYWKSFDIDSIGNWIAYTKPKGVGIGVRSLSTSGIGEERLVGAEAGKARMVKFRPNHEELAFIGSNISLWSLDSAAKTPLREMGEMGEWDYAWFDPTGSFVSASLNGALSRWDLTAPPDADPLVFRFAEGIGSVSFERQGRWMATAGSSTIAFFPLNRSYPYILHGTNFSGANNVRFTPDGKSLVVGFLDDKSNVRLWRMPGEIQVPRRTLWCPAPMNTTAIDIDPRGKYVVAGTSVEGVFLISTQDGKSELLKSEFKEAYCQDVAFSSDGNLAAAAFDGAPGNAGIEIWDLESGTSRVLQQSKKKAFDHLLFAPDGSLFSGDFDGNLQQWDLKDGTGKLLRTGKGAVGGLAISKDGRYLASTIWSPSTDKAQTSELVIHDLKEGKATSVLSHGNRVNSVAFDPSGRLLITGDADGAIRIGPINAEPKYVLLGHETINDIIVHPDGKWIASSDGAAPIVRLWTMPDGESLSVLPYQKFLDRLSQITNVRVVPEKNSSSGFRIEYASFPGWKVVPKW